jgi:serine/threonine protein kinase
MNSSGFSPSPFPASHPPTTQLTQLNDMVGDRFIIQSSLPSSGIGQSYLATDAHRPSQPQCLIQHLSLSSTPSSTEHLYYQGLRQEAIALDHVGSNQYTPQLIAFIEHQNHTYLIREWIEGPSLQAMLERQSSWDAAVAIHISIQLLEALTVLHRHGVMHSSLCPQSVIQHHRSKLWKLINFKQSTLFSISPEISLGGCQPLMQDDLRAVGHLIQTMAARLKIPHQSAEHQTNISILQEAANGLIQQQPPYQHAQTALAQMRSQCSTAIRHKADEAQLGFMPELLPLSPSGINRFPDLEISDEDHPNRHRAITTGMATGLLTATALSAGIFYFSPSEELSGKRASHGGITQPSFISVAAADNVNDPASTAQSSETTLPNAQVGQSLSPALPPVPPPPASYSASPPPQPNLAPPLPLSPLPEIAEASTETSETSENLQNHQSTEATLVSNQPEKERPAITRDRLHTPLHEIAVNVLTQKFSDRPEHLLARMSDLASRYAQDKNYIAESFISQKIERLEEQLYPSNHPNHVATDQRQEFLANTLTHSPMPNNATRHHATPNPSGHYATQPVLDSQYIADRADAHRTLDHDAVNAAHDPNHSALALTSENTPLSDDEEVASVLETIETDKIENASPLANGDLSADSEDAIAVPNYDLITDSEDLVNELTDNDKEEDQTESTANLSPSLSVPDTSVALSSVILYTKMTDDGQFLAQIYADNSIAIAKLGSSQPSYRIDYFPGSIYRISINEATGTIHIIDRDQTESWWNLQTGDRMSAPVTSNPETPNPENADPNNGSNPETPNPENADPNNGLNPETPDSEIEKIDLVS